jgi:hypothetical protein
MTAREVGSKWAPRRLTGFYIDTFFGCAQLEYSLKSALALMLSNTSESSRDIPFAMK